jgi:hypothetical protein
MERERDGPGAPCQSYPIGVRRQYEDRDHIVGRDPFAGEGEGEERRGRM